MRHRNAHRKLGRVIRAPHGAAPQPGRGAAAHERIETTVPKAKELRPFVERLITIAKRGVKAAEPKGRTLSARRLVMRDVLNDDVVDQAVRQLAPRFMERPGGYTRILKLGHRRGDAARGRADRAGRQRVRPEEGRSREEGRRRSGRAGEAPKSRRASASACAPRRSDDFAAARRKRRATAAPKPRPAGPRAARPRRPRRRARPAARSQSPRAVAGCRVQRAMRSAACSQPGARTLPTGLFLQIEQPSRSRLHGILAPRTARLRPALRHAGRSRRLGIQMSTPLRARHCPHPGSRLSSPCIRPLPPAAERRSSRLPRDLHDCCSHGWWCR